MVAGAFSVRLGATQPIGEDVLANPTLYLQVEVKLPSEQNYITLLGRQQLMHAPYARSSTGDFRVGGKLTVGAASDAA